MTVPSLARLSLTHSVNIGVSLVGPRAIVPKVKATGDFRGYILGQEDEEEIYRAIQTLFPPIDDDYNITFGNMAHFGLFNWFNLLSRGRNWKALNYLTEWAAKYLESVDGQGHPSVVWSFMRKQARLLKEVTEGVQFAPLPFSGFGGTQFMDPLSAVWFGIVEVKDRRDLEVLSKIATIVDDDEDRAAKRAKEM